YYNQGVALCKLRRYNEAVECFDKAINLNPAFQQAWYNKAIALQNLGKREQANKCFKEAQRL
ncbi:MAG: tetratricopeptide repeat protein, partial [bacterium]